LLLQIKQLFNALKIKFGEISVDRFGSFLLTSVSALGEAATPPFTAFKEKGKDFIEKH
jgi:hypothetical protein